MDNIKGFIGGNGELFIRRKNKYKVMRCIYHIENEQDFAGIANYSDICCDACPFFSDPVEIYIPATKNTPAKNLIELELCKRKLIFESLADNRQY